MEARISTCNKMRENPSPQADFFLLYLIFYSFSFHYVNTESYNAIQQVYTTRQGRKMRKFIVDHDSREWNLINGIAIDFQVVQNPFIDFSIHVDCALLPWQLKAIYGIIAIEISLIRFPPLSLPAACVNDVGK